MISNLFSVWAGIISDLAGTFAFIIGGVWVIRNYRLNRTGKWNLKMVISPEAIYYNEEYDMVIINILLNNIGKIKIVPGSSGLQVTVRKIDSDV